MRRLTELVERLGLKERWAWAVLYALLALLTLGAATLDRSDWLSVMGDEATYIMQAESLAFDLDFAYSRDDYQRFRDHWRVRPQGLILQSGDGGASIIYGKPFYYAAFLAPFVRLSPLHGPFLANALLLALACLCAARVLERRHGRAAPLWVSAVVFASTAFVYTYWVHADLFLMCLTAIAFAIAFDQRRRSRDESEVLDRRGHFLAALPWLAVGALIAVVAFSRPLYLSLFLPALVAVPRGRRRLGIPMLLAGGLFLFLASAAIHQALADSWTSYGAERRGFYRHTGFPEVDFPTSEWSESI